MADKITSIAVAEERYGELWGVRVNTYKLNGVLIDFESLMVNVAQNRAVTVESEIDPLSKVVTKRNERLQKLGEALSDLSGAQTSFKSDDQGSKLSSSYGYYLKSDTCTILKELGMPSWEDGKIDLNNGNINKAYVEKAVQLVKSKIDRLNNDAQNDMTRLQSLVDKRDESYSTASSLMNSISDTRSNAIKNIG